MVMLMLIVIMELLTFIVLVQLLPSEDHLNVVVHCHVSHTTLSVATPLWPSVGVKPNTWRFGDLESFKTLECSELNSKAQNTLHLGCS